MSLLRPLRYSTSALRAADDAKTQLTMAGKADDAAVLVKDAKALGNLYDDAGVFFDEKGTRFNKQGFIALYTDPKMTRQTAGSKVDSLRIFGNTAIDSGVWTGIGKSNGKLFHMVNRYGESLR